MSQRLLHIDSSILGEISISRQLSKKVVDYCLELRPSLEVCYRDLAEVPLTHLSEAYLAAQNAPAQHEGSLKHELAVGSEVMDEFMAADIVVIGAPMYNLTISSQLKVWIDRILVAGKTFHYTENGLEGLAGDKQVIIALSQGGIYSPGTPQAHMDHHEPLLRNLFAFIGVTNVNFITASGVSLSPDHRTASVKNTLKDITSLQLR